MSRNFEDLKQLFDIIKNRINDNNPESYSSKLNDAGVEKICRKIGEEATEVIIASFINDKNNNQKNKQDLIGEISDLLYHILVLMINQNLTFEDILQELNKRNNKNE